MQKKSTSNIIQERFGDPIGSYAGDAPIGVRDEPEVCPECGMMSIDGNCECNDNIISSNGFMKLDEDEIDEVAPPGDEKLVKALKKNPDIDNPWAVAWSIHNKHKKK
jgi:hypothetical protein